MSTNIFEEAKEKVVPVWAKFVNAGDSVQGTYVGKIVGQKDGYNNEQIIYQLLQEDGSVTNVGFGLNKKVLNADMQSVKFGQIIGFKFKGTVNITDRRTGKNVGVKDFALHQDPKIVDAKWLQENQGNMPEVVKATPVMSAEDSVNEFANDVKGDVPFSSPTSLTNEDKLKVIEKLAKDKLGATTTDDVKLKVMENLNLAYIPINYDKITVALASL